MRWALPILAIGALFSAPTAAREIVEASAPQDVSVTVYRNPDRGVDEAMERDWPQGFAMISEARTVTLPAGQSTIRFEGVAEGMVAVSAIVTGLPGGTIEKNRNADLLSPAALLDGTLGNRVRITRTNPGTGVETTESGVVRTRADGGLVLQTRDGYEAVRCSGVPERLSFDRLPDGLSSKPIFSIDTQDEAGGTYQVTLTYLAWGFDWEAHYVATLKDESARGAVTMRLMSWLTLLNDNGQGFPNAELLAIAGTLNVESDFEGLSDPPTARPLRLTCYPLGSTAAGTPIYRYENQNDKFADGMVRRQSAPAPVMMESMSDIVLTGAALSQPAMVAKEEQLGDLKLYRIPEKVDVSANSLKQVAFLNKENVSGEFIYTARCNPYADFGDALSPAQMVFETVNDEEHGLGVAMPMGGFTMFEPTIAGELLVNEQSLRDHAVGQDVEIGLGNSSAVFSECAQDGDLDPDAKRSWIPMRAKLSNANEHAVTVRLAIGQAGEWEIRTGRNKPRLKNGEQTVELTVPANDTRDFRWRLRRPKSYFSDD